VLPQFLAKHVLALESAHEDGWLGRQALVEALDAYMGSTTPDGRAKLPSKQTPDSKGGDAKNPGNSSSGGGSGNGGPRPAPVPAPRTIVKRCYICSSPNHLQSACPQRRQNNFDRRANFGGGQRPQPQPRVGALCK